MRKMCSRDGTVWSKAKPLRRSCPVAVQKPGRTGWQLEDHSSMKRPYWLPVTKSGKASRNPIGWKHFEAIRGLAIHIRQPPRLRGLPLGQAKNSKKLELQASKIGRAHV